MDDQRFDAFVRGLAGASSRRQVLRGLLGLGGLAAASTLRSAEAARRPSPTPTPVRCPGEQIPGSGGCVCPAGKAKCGPDCCPAGAQCCDNACCYGICYGEELCCPTGSIVCDGQCRAWECCSDSDCSPGSTCHPETHTCQCIPDCTGKTCGDDGCGGSCGSCEGQICLNGSCASCGSGTMYCEGDGQCHQCCSSSAECAATQGGSADCWTCNSQSCNQTVPQCAPSLGYNCCAGFLCELTNPFSGYCHPA